MKKLSFLLFAGTYFFTTAIKAQPECSGVYLTANDFIAGKLCNVCATRSASKGSYYNLLAINHFFIIQPGYAWRKIDKEDVFAIQGCEGELVRIYQGNNYYLVNPGEEIPIYKAFINPTSKGNVIRVRYCFSRSLVSEIRDLSLDNLKAEFSGNFKFLDALGDYLKDESDLYAYNYREKSFELNRLYNTTK